MTLLSVVIAYLILRWWGAAKPLHRDAWYYRWCGWLSEQPALSKWPVSVLVLSILGPVAALLLLLILANSIWYWLQLLIAVPVLLYAVGRGKYSGHVMHYLRAREQKDWIVAMESYQSLLAPARQVLPSETHEAEPEPEPEHGDWMTLDQRMLTAVSYRGFERTFAVIFWFVLLGPAGALLYRLSALYLQFDREHAPSEGQARRWLWLLEWPAARVLGLSFALTGNFVGCIRKSRDYLWSTEEGSAEVLVNHVLGALQVDETLPTSLETVERELNLTLSLFSRTLIFWICVLAILAVLL